MFIARIAFPLFAAVLAVPAFAAVVDDAVRLATGGVSEEVMLSWAERQSGYEITAADIVAMKDAKVPDRVVVALIKHAGAPEIAAAEPVERQEVIRREPVRGVEREVVRYVDSTPSVEYVSTPGVSLVGSYYYPRYRSYRYYSYPRYYSYSPRYYYPRYYRGYYPRYYGYYPRYYGYGYYGRPYYRSGFHGGFSINF